MKYLLSTLIISSSLLAMVSEDIIRKPTSLKETTLKYNQGTFYVKADDSTITIERSNLCSNLRKLSPRQIESILSHKDSLLYLRKLSNEKYALELQDKLRGGTGPITAWCAGTVVKGLCWTGLMLVSSLVYKGSEKAAHGDRTMAAGTSVIAVGGGIGAAGGFTAVAAGIEAAGNAVSAAVLAIPLPLP